MVDVNEIRAARAKHRLDIPGGCARAHSFPSKLRMKLTQQDGRAVYEVEGYATIWDRGYEMWDMFGSYTETISNRALDKSLMLQPDVAFLVNHRGVTMARTTNDSLTLSKDDTGLAIRAFLNADRQDVRDLASAIGDQLVDEMSFAFMLNGGEWNEEYDEFVITEADINRGDVSAVNYGANPYTSITARSADLLRDLDRVPEPVARAAYSRIQKRLTDLGPALTPSLDSLDPAELEGIKDWPVIDETGDDDDLAQGDTPKREGKSLRLVRLRLDS
jgi:HK97 family phage prohead protease